MPTFLILYMGFSYVFFLIWLIMHPNDRSPNFTYLYSTPIYDVYLQNPGPGSIAKQFVFAFLIVFPMTSLIILVGILFEKYGHRQKQISKRFIQLVLLYNIVGIIITWLYIKSYG